MEKTRKNLKIMPEYFREYFIRNKEIRPVSRFDEVLVFQGKSLYDAIRIIKGIPLFFEKHYHRLIYTAAVAEIEILLTEKEIRKRIEQLMEANHVNEGNIKLVFNQNDENGTRCMLAYFVPFRYPTADELLNGVDTLFFRGERKIPNSKLIDKKLREATENAKNENRVFEVILVDKDGFITEGSRTNVFFIRNNHVYTTPLTDVLPGVTRSCVIEICGKSGIPLTETKIHSSEISQYNALFLSGTSPGILPVKKLEHNSIPANNKVMREIMRCFDEVVKNYMELNMRKLISS